MEMLVKDHLLIPQQLCDWIFTVTTKPSHAISYLFTKQYPIVCIHGSLTE